MTKEARAQFGDARLAHCVAVVDVYVHVMRVRGLYSGHGIGVG